MRLHVSGGMLGFLGRCPGHASSFSQGDRGSRDVFLGCPTGPECLVELEVFRTLMLERLRYRPKKQPQKQKAAT